MSVPAPGARAVPRLRCGLVLGTDELDEVERLYTEHGMWDSAFG